MRTRDFFAILLKILILALAALVLVNANRAFFNVAWGAGNWLGRFLPKWGIAFFVFAAASLAVWVAIVLGLVAPKRLAAGLGPVMRARERMGWLRWVVILFVVIFPPWLFQYSYLGLVFIAPAFRLTVWIAAALVCGFLLTRDSSRPLNWPAALIGLLLAGGAILLTFPFQDVSSFPFSLGWSEGNRLWDYSILFGRARYLYPAGAPIPTFLDLGRQFVGGVDFLYPNLTIWQARLWLGLMEILPYLAVGLAVFRRPKNGSLSLWLLTGLWGFAFLRQGLIHTPLVLVALVVALTWRRSYWISIPCLAAAAFAATLSRYTWVFAPAMWVGMLVIVDAELENGRIPLAAWRRAILLAGAALAGGLGYWLYDTLKSGIIVGKVTTAVSRQPLLWYRLFPNETLGPGILYILIFAILPLVVVLFYLIRSPRWNLNLWQKLAIFAPLAAFLAVGLVASTKIGGGGDLHNLDMFLIALLFLAGLAWDRFGHRWMLEPALPVAMRIVVVLLVAMPVYFPLINMRPLLTADSFPRLRLLTKSASPRDLNLLPSSAEADLALKDIQRRVANAQIQGEVLFMDQRQLLTFGFIQDVPLAPDYEKKYLMDSAMTDSAISVFAPFYADLKAHRFALIVSEPLRLPIKDSELGFSEENNAWVKWVSSAVLCYYEPDKTYQDERVQLLTPRATPVECNLPIP